MSHVKFVFVLFLSLGLTAQAQEVIYGNGSGNRAKVTSLNRQFQDRFPTKRNWNWTVDQLQSLYINTVSGIVNHNEKLPYFQNEGPASVLNTGQNRDIQPSDGWTLIYRDFGSPNSGAVMPNFLLYNKYRGLMRFFFYNTRLSDFSYCQVMLSQPNANKASPLFNMGEPRTFLDSFDKTIERQTITSVGWYQWSFVDFQITGYDPSPAIDAAIKFEITGIKKEDVQISGTLTLDQVLAEASVGGKSKGLGDAFTSGAKYYKNAGKAQKDLKKELDKHPNAWYSKKLRGLVDGSFAKLIPAMSGGIGFFSSFIFGGKQNAVQPLSFKGDLDLSGTNTQSTHVYSLMIRLPGAPLSDPNDSAKPLSAEKLGIYNLNRPVWDGVFNEFCYWDYRSYDRVCEYYEELTLESPLNVQVNPAISSVVTVRAGRIKNAAETVYQTASTFHNIVFIDEYDEGDGPEWMEDLAIELTIDYSPFVEPIVIATIITPLL